MTLAVITSEAENSFLHIAEDYATSHWWFGLQQVDGAWAWDDGTKVSYTNWESGEPNDGGDCAEYDGTSSDAGEWKDRSCTYTQAYICEG